MIKENQKLLNFLHVLSDAFILWMSFPVAFWVRFYIFDGTVTEPFTHYLLLATLYTGAQMFTYTAFGLYQSFRRESLWRELLRLWEGTLLDTAAVLGLLFIARRVHFSRWTLALALALILTGLSAKRILLRTVLRQWRRKGYNQKHVLIAGGGRLARRYWDEIQTSAEFGYRADGYVARRQMAMGKLPYLGGIDCLPEVLERYRPDEVVAALEPEEFSHLPVIIEKCEKAGVRLSIIPSCADYMPPRPQFDNLNGIPILNIRRIPLDNWANAFLKRSVDVVGSALLLVLLSPVLLLCALGVKGSSPGPVIFRQERVGKDKKLFTMLKFRSMRVNDAQNTAWSRNCDPRKTKFGAFMRKCSMDELPQLWNVLRGDMSLVGPRPELPHHVERFRGEVPRYMVKHQVRPGITGWAQVNGYRGDTSIRARVEHDIYYIENWSLWLDVYILLLTVFGGKFINSETLVERDR